MLRILNPRCISFKPIFIRSAEVPKQNFKMQWREHYQSTPDFMPKSTSQPKPSPSKVLLLCRSYSSSSFEKGKQSRGNLKSPLTPISGSNPVNSGKPKLREKEKADGLTH
jgi:hypothetical protein